MFLALIVDGDTMVACMSIKFTGHGCAEHLFNLVIGLENHCSHTQFHGHNEFEAPLMG